MNSPIGGKNRPWHARLIIRNADAAAIPTGCAVVMNANGTDDGVAVVLPSTAGVIKTNALRIGVGAGQGAASLAVGDFGEAIVAGWCPVTRQTRMTKAASTDIWASFPAGAVGGGLYPETVNNGFTNVGSIASTGANPLAILLDTYASATTVASDAYSAAVPLSATAYTVNVKSWIKGLG